MGRREGRRGTKSGHLIVSWRRARSRWLFSDSAQYCLGFCSPWHKSSDKPKKQQKKKPQKTLKERRSEKRAAKKFSSGSLLRADE